MSSSEKAFRKFLLCEELICILESHVLNLLNAVRVLVSNFFPEASVLGFPIIVARPISGRDKETGDPVLALSSLSSTVNARHSGLARSRFCSENYRATATTYDFPRLMIRNCSLHS